MAGFTQIIEMQTSRIDEVEVLIGELRNRLDDGGSSASRRGTITADRDRDGFYLSIITAGGPDRRPLAGIEVFTGGLRESMIAEAETHEVDGTEVGREI
jgi:hypothetical protein